MAAWSSPRRATIPKVTKLVYIAAFAPDKGESVASLIKNPPPGAPVPPILPPQDGFLFLDKAKFAASFAADVDAEKAAFMADSQVPWGVGALEGAVSEPAWKTKPSWYLVATDDKMIPPAGAALHVEARRRDGNGERGKPRHLRVAAGGCRLDHQDCCDPSIGRLSRTGAAAPIHRQRRLSDTPCDIGADVRDEAHATVARRTRLAAFVVKSRPLR